MKLPNQAPPVKAGKSTAAYSKNIQPSYCDCSGLTGINADLCWLSCGLSV